MTESTQSWLERAKALSPEKVSVLKQVAEGATYAAIAEAQSQEESTICSMVVEIIRDLDLGPFETMESEYATLGGIYASYLAPRPEPPAAPAQMPKAERPGNGHANKKLSAGGIVIEIPPDTVGMDVITGPVPDEGLAVERVSALIKEKRAFGLKPAYLVLTPSATDATATNFRIVFFERAPDSAS